MNQKLALYFDDESIIAAIQPFEGKFTILSRTDSEQAFSLFFYLQNDSIQYGKQFKSDFENKDRNAFGNFYNFILDETASYKEMDYDKRPIQLLDKIIEDVRSIYFETFDRFTSEPMDRYQKIDTVIAFSDNISDKAKRQINNYLPKFGLKLDAALHNFPEMLVRMLIHDEGMPKNGQYVVLQTSSTNLIISIIETNGWERTERIAYQMYKSYGLDPRIGVLAKYVVDEANNGLHLYDKDELADEYGYQMNEATEWNRRLINTGRLYLDVKVMLSKMQGTKRTITIHKNKIERLTKDRSRQVFRFFDTLCKKTNCANPSRIIMVGDALSNQLVKESFYQFNSKHISQYTSVYIREALRGLLLNFPNNKISTTANKIHNIPKIQAVQQKIETSAFNSVDVQKRIDTNTVFSTQLKPGDVIIFGWNPGREVTAVYNGHNQYIISKAQNAKVKVGDTFISDQFSIGKPARLTEVIRTTQNNKYLGIYVSGGLTLLRLDRRS